MFPTADVIAQVAAAHGCAVMPPNHDLFKLILSFAKDKTPSKAAYMSVIKKVVIDVAEQGMLLGVDVHDVLHTMSSILNVIIYPCASCSIQMFGGDAGGNIASIHPNVGCLTCVGVYYFDFRSTPIHEHIWFFSMVEAYMRIGDVRLQGDGWETVPFNARKRLGLVGGDASTHSLFKETKRIMAQYDAVFEICDNEPFIMDNGDDDGEDDDVIGGHRFPATMDHWPTRLNGIEADLK